MSDNGRAEIRLAESYRKAHHANNKIGRHTNCGDNVVK